MKVFTSTYDIRTGSFSQRLPQVDSQSTLVLVFGAPELRDRPSLLSEIRQRYPQSIVVGCSTAGEIARESVRDGTISIAVAQFEATHLQLATVDVADPAESFAAGALLARKLARSDLRAVFVLSEGLHVNGSELVRGVNGALDRTVVTTGGLAGDGTAFGRTWVYDGSGIRERVIVGIGFSGEAFMVAHGSQGGWRQKGREHEVTLSKGSVVLEIDGRPALDLYEEYLGALRDELPASGLLFPLSMRVGSDTKRLTRTLLAIDRDKRSLTFAGDVPMHAQVSVMEADVDHLVSGARDAGRSATAIRVPDTADSLTVAISCVGRRLLLKERSADEVAAVRAQLPPRSEVVGFYSYGEISPSGFGQCDLHNQTMTLTVFSEDPRIIERAARRSSDRPSGRASVRPPTSSHPPPSPPVIASSPPRSSLAPAPVPVTPAQPPQPWFAMMISAGVFAALIVYLVWQLQHV